MFQSTLPRRERPQQKRTLSHVLCFNPRSREGSDCHDPAMLKKALCVSIHAPAKGATDYHHGLGETTIRFNPRSREGSDSMDRGGST